MKELIVALTLPAILLKILGSVLVYSINTTEPELVGFVGEMPTISRDLKAYWCSEIKDCSILAEAVVYESRNQPKIGQYAVAHVVINRAETENRWGKTIEEVVYQPRQFSYTHEKQRSSPTPADIEKALAVAYDVLLGYVDSPVGDATHYHTTTVNPRWANSLEIVGTVGSHIFYR